MSHIRTSRFVHFIDFKKGNNFVIAVNSLSMSVVVIDIENANHLKKHLITLLSDNDQAILRKHKILTTLEEDENDLAIARSFFKKKIIGTLCLMLTDACNLRCQYCFVEHRFPSNHKFSMMTSRAAKKGIDLFVSVLPQSIKKGLAEPTINFYGGEATLNLNTLEFSLDYIKRLKNTAKLPDNLLISLNTNATLIDIKIAQLLKKHEVAASVSIDGPKNIHDMVRLDKNGHGSFDKAMKGIENLKKTGVNIGISCAVDMHNLLSLENIAKWYANSLKVKVFGFNILLEGGIKYPNFNLPEYAEIVGEKMVNVFKICREIGVREERTSRLASAFAQGQIHYYDCGACGQQIVVDPSGMIGVCHSYTDTKLKKYFVASKENIDPFSHPNWKEWRMRSPLNMNQCLGCIALSLCGGGCPYNSDYRKGSIWEIDEAYCPFAKKMTTFLIKEVAKLLVARENPEKQMGPLALPHRSP